MSTPADRLPALRVGVRLEVFTVGWMVVEAVRLDGRRSLDALLTDRR